MVRVVWHIASENIPSQSTELGERTPVSTRMTEFIPERWLPSHLQAEAIQALNDPQLKPSALQPLNQQAYIPFSAGYGRCPGRALGLQNAK